MCASRLCLLPVLVLAVLAGCESPPPRASPSLAAGTLRLEVHAPTAVAPADVRRVSVTVSGADMSPRTTELVLTDGVWGGVLGDLPAGPQRTVLGRAFNASNVLRYEGRAENITLTAGATGLVTLYLVDVSTAPPFANEAPIVAVMTVNPTSVIPGGQVTLSAGAYDPNGDTVSFAWTAPSGTLSSTTQPNTVWTAPFTTGPVNLVLTVRDPRGASVSVSVPLRVRGTGVASWWPTQSMASARADHQAVLLPSGKVLVAGGHDGSATLATAEVYDPATRTWSPTGAMASPRSSSPALLLPSGKVLVAGGYVHFNTTLAAAELYDPATGTWSPTQAMGTPRQRHVAAPLPSGKVLVMGGLNGNTALATAEVYDPATGTWSPTQAMASPRYGFTATPLLDGKVLVAGGSDLVNHLATAEVYDPATGTWSPTQAMSTPRAFHGAARLPSGKVLLAAGSNSRDYVEAASTTYDPATGTWSYAGYLQTPRKLPSVTVLADDRLLVAGGFISGRFDVVEMYEPATGTWRPEAYMNVARDSHTATRLASGLVLVTGGSTYNGVVNLAELYFPAVSP